MNLKVKKLQRNATVPGYQSKQASGLDLHSIRYYSLYEGETRVVETGIAVEIPEGFEGQIRPRSSISAKGMLIHTGTIDSDYRGELKIIVTNISGQFREVTTDQRIAQLVITPIARVTTQEVEELNDTERGTNGIGSTGA